jgi:hypothetical protein
MKKIIYSILGLILIGIIIFAGLYINGNYNDDSKVSEDINSGKIITKTELAPNKVEIESGAHENVGAKKIAPQTESKITVAEKINNIIKSGNFNKIDSVHSGSGEVKITSDENYYYINFQNNFSVVNLSLIHI